jgi:hypothetical protein
MGLETATYISQLVTSNPTGADKKLQGDDHLRLLKSVLQSTFPTASRAFNLARWAEKEADVLEKSADYNQVTADNGKMVFFDTSGGNRKYNLLSAGSMPVGTVVFIDRDVSANTLTIDAGSETVNGAATLVLLSGESGFLYNRASSWRFFLTRSSSTFTSALNVILSAAGDIALLQSTLASAARSPDLVLYRNRNGVNNDILGSLAYRGKNTAGTEKDLARLRAKWIDVTAGSEDAYLLVSALKANVETDELTIGDGLTLGAATGGQPGTGKINVTEIKINGTTLVDSFAAKLLHLQDQKTAGTAGGTFTSGAWRTHELTTEEVDQIGSTLSSNTFTLPAGTYIAEASAMGYACSGHKLRLRNITDGTTAIVGSHADCSTGGISTVAHLFGRFTIADTKTFELQHRCQTTKSTDGFGQAMSFGEAEVYADLRIWKVA